MKSVNVYFEASPKIVENIDKAMDAHLAPLAHAFRGRLIGDEEDSTHKGAPGSRIIDFRVAKAPIGSCGAKGQGCSFNKPIACYTCRAFRPWIDGPHQAVLTDLLARRDAQLETTSPRVAAVNDRTIVAVSEVIQICEKLSAEKSDV